MSEEWMTPNAEVKAIFDIYKDNIESGIREALASAEECDAKRSLENFYSATLWLKGLDAVFTERIPEVEAYSDKTKRRMRIEVIPTLAEKVGVCRGR